MSMRCETAIFIRPESADKIAIRAKDHIPFVHKATVSGRFCRGEMQGYTVTLYEKGGTRRPLTETDLERIEQ